MMPRALWQLLEESPQPTPGAVRGRAPGPAELLGVPPVTSDSDPRRPGAGLCRALLAPLRSSNRGRIARIGFCGGDPEQRSGLAAAVVRLPDVRDAYEAVLWLRVGPEPDLVQIQGRAAELFSITPRPILLNAERGRIRLRHFLGHQRILLVLDDIHRPLDAELLEMVGARGRVLLISQNRQTLDTLGAEVLVLDTAAVRDRRSESFDGAEPSFARASRLPGEKEKARDLLFDGPSMVAAFETVGLDPLLTELRRCFEDPEVAAPARLLHQALWQGSEVLEAHPELLPEQIIGRLHGALHPRLRGLTDTLAELLAAGEACRLVPRTRVLERPEPAWLGRLEGHTSMVFRIDRTQDGHLVSASYDKTIRVWAPDSGETLHLLRGLPRVPEAVAALPDGRVAIGDEGGSIHFWQPGAARPECRIDAHSRTITRIRILDDQRMVSASADRTLGVWDIERGKAIRILEGHTDRVWDVAVLPEGRIASASDDATVRVWDVESGRCERTWPAGDAVFCVGTLPGNRIAFGTRSDRLKVRHLHGEAEQRSVLTWDEPRCTLGLPDGWLLVGMAGPTLCQWNLETGEADRVLYRHETRVADLSSLGSERIATASWDGTIGLWDLARKAEDAFEPCETVAANLCAMVHIDRGRVALAGTDDSVRLWHLDTGRTLRALGTGWYHCLAAAGAWVYGGGEDGTVRKWSLANDAQEIWDHGQGEPIEALAVSEAGLVAIAVADEEVISIRSSRGELLGRLEGHRSPVESLSALPGGWLASAGDDHEILLWDPATLRQASRLEGHEGCVTAIAAAGPGGLLSASSDGTVRHWDLESGAFSILDDDGDDLCHVVASGPDRVVTADRRRVRVFRVGGSPPEAGTGRLLASFLFDDGIAGLASPTPGKIVVGDHMYRIGVLDLVGGADPAGAADPVGAD